MKIALFCAYNQSVTEEYAHTIHRLVQDKGHTISIDLRLQKNFDSAGRAADYFDSSQGQASDFDVLFSLGGDGTLLRSIPFIYNSNLPILGINTGRLGFLTSLQKESLEKGLDLFFEGHYKTIHRSLIQIQTDRQVEAIEDFGYALNEVTLIRKNTTSMLNIETQINGRELTTYWADGLIVSTPTGSTGYSMSNGGPILTPATENFILSPIAPHNINLRPLVLPDSDQISIRVNGRGTHHLLSMDARSISLPMNTEINLQKAPFQIQTIQIQGDNFFNTLRNKLFWGFDTRNEQ